MCNAIAVARVCRACRAGFALIMLSAPVAMAEYGPRTTIGKSYQQTSDTTSIYGIDQDTCLGAEYQSSCYVLFQPTPQKRPLIVQHVSCSVDVDTGGLDAATTATLSTQKGETFLVRQTHLVPVSTSYGVWAVSSPVKHLLKSGERAVVGLHNSEAWWWNAVQCTIAGELQ